MEWAIPSTIAVVQVQGPPRVQNQSESDEHISDFSALQVFISFNNFVFF